jgi:hypothetical protein
VENIGQKRFNPNALKAVIALKSPVYNSARVLQLHWISNYYNYDRKGRKVSKLVSKSFKKTNKNMILRISIVIAACICCICCGQRPPQKQELQAKVDSLQRLVEKQQAMETSLVEAQSLIASEYPDLDIASNPTATIKEYVKRTKALNDRVVAAEQLTAHYTALLHRTNLELAATAKALSKVQYQVVMSANQNENLMHLVSLQNSEINDQVNKLKIKQQGIMGELEKITPVMLTANF